MGTADSLADSGADSNGRLPPLALIAGPTASGKSDLAVRLALALIARGQSATVINADSAQVYADLAVLSARPTADEMAKVPHRLFGEWDGAEACSAADWAQRARQAIGDVHAEGGVPILVGGTGLYLRTLLNGIAPVSPIDPAIRDAVRALPQALARRELEALDPECAAKLAPGDAARTTRALEVIRSTGQTLSQWQQRTSGGIGGTVVLHPAVLLPQRDWLYARCDQRFAAMLDGGAIAEVKTLLARDLSPDLPVMRAIGVREIAALLDGSATRAETMERGQQSTRNYAKRQYTWFRNQSPPDWPRLESYSDDATSLFARIFHD